jgi:eukaryotic-like serine/threonine-protein kinase
LPIQIQREFTGDQRFWITGAMDESADFMSIVSSATGRIRINTRNVSKVSSIGVKGFLTFLAQCSTSSVEVIHEECCVPLVHHLPSMLRANPHSQVESVMAPFSCVACHRGVDVRLMQPRIALIKTLIGGQKCPACGSALRFDELPQEFFSFLKE